MHQLFEPVFILQELGIIFLGTEFPSHIAGGPQAGIPVFHRLIDSLFEFAKHLVDVKIIVGREERVGRQDKARFGDLAFDIDAGGGEEGPDARDHGAAVEVETAIPFLQLLLYEGGERRELSGRGAGINEALMTGVRLHCAECAR